MASNRISDELINDANEDIPMDGLETVLELKHRFESRLGRLVNATVVVPPTNGSGVIIIYIMPSPSISSSTTVYDKAFKAFTTELGDVLKAIAENGDGQMREECVNDLWDLLLCRVATGIDGTAQKLSELFEKNKEAFDTLVCRVLGLDERYVAGSSIDLGLSEKIIKLHQMLRTYDGAMMKMNDLVTFAFDVIDHQLEARVRSLLPFTFATRLYELLCQLSHPKRTLHTLVRAATTVHAFSNVDIRYGPPPPATLAASTLAAKQSPVTHLTKATEYLPTTIGLPAFVPLAGPMVSIIGSYLALDDLGLPIPCLQPRAKQCAAWLVGCLMQGMRVPANTAAYFSFGFAACENEEEERILCGIYRGILLAAADRRLIFAKVVDALEEGNISTLCRADGAPALQERLPAVHSFLNTKSSERPSVFRLRQFLQDSGADEPFACLKRDYGFRFCTQREHVSELKNIYEQVLNKAGAVRVHQACIHGRLRECALEFLGYIRPGHRRLLQNDYPNPLVGFDNGAGLQYYVKPLFKKSSKG